MMYDLGRMSMLKDFMGEILAGVAFVLLGGGALFLAVTLILLAGKAVRFAWGW